MLLPDRLDAVLKEIFTNWEIPGMAVGIVERGKIAYSRFFGVQSLETQVPVTDSTIFCLASIGKCFVSSAVMQLVEQGRFQLETPLVQVLPDFAMDDERVANITIQQVLSHTSGIPDMDELEYEELVSRPEVDKGAAERYVRCLKDEKLVHAPGERFLYSNIGYNVLGHLISRVSGQSFEAYMREHILLPSGMPNSTFLVAEVDRRRVAQPHLRAPGMMVNPIYPYHRADAPSSFLHVTLTDLCQWAIICLKRGSNNGKHLLTPASYERMWTPVAKRNTPPFREVMGLGWNLGHFEGALTVGHGGAGFGWFCVLVLLPERDEAAMVLSNEESMANERAVRAMIRAMLGFEPQVGSVSFMVPVSQALAAGGILAAVDRLAELREDDRGEFYFVSDDLVSLAYQLIGAGKIDLAVEVLEMNIREFPEYLEAYTLLSDLHLQNGELSQAGDVLQEALIIQPGGTDLLERLNKIRRAKEGNI